MHRRVPIYRHCPRRRDSPFSRRFLKVKVHLPVMRIWRLRSVSEIWSVQSPSPGKSGTRSGRVGPGRLLLSRSPGAQGHEGQAGEKKTLESCYYKYRNSQGIIPSRDGGRIRRRLHGDHSAPFAIPSYESTYVLRGSHVYPSCIGSEPRVRVAPG